MQPTCIKLNLGKSRGNDISNKGLIREITMPSVDFRRRTIEICWLKVFWCFLAKKIAYLTYTACWYSDHLEFFNKKSCLKWTAYFFSPTLPSKLWRHAPIMFLRNSGSVLGIFYSTDNETRINELAVWSKSTVIPCITYIYIQ